MHWQDILSHIGYFQYQIQDYKYFDSLYIYSVKWDSLTSAYNQYHSHFIHFIKQMYYGSLSEQHYLLLVTISKHLALHLPCSNCIASILIILYFFSGIHHTLENAHNCSSAWGNKFVTLFISFHGVQDKSFYESILKDGFHN